VPTAGPGDFGENTGGKSEGARILYFPDASRLERLTAFRNGGTSQECHRRREHGDLCKSYEWDRRFPFFNPVFCPRAYRAKIRRERQDLVSPGRRSRMRKAVSLSN